MEKEFEEQVDAELAAYNGEHETDYDFDDFYYACWENDIAKDDTIGLPMLNDVFNTILSEKKYLAQPEFNFDNNLPF